MGWIGREPAIGNYQVCDALTASATATYALAVGGTSVSPESANHMIVSLNGVIQKPISSFTVSGSNIVFNSALTSSDSIDFILLLGSTLNVGVPSDDTVGAAQIKDDLISGTTALTSTPDNTDEILISDAGTLKRIDYSLISGFSMINETTASNSASVSFTLSSSFKHFMVLYENIIPASDQQHFFLTHSNDSASTFESANYNFTIKGFEHDDAEDFYGANGQSSIQLTRYQVGSDTAEFGVSGVMYLGGVSTNTAVHKGGVHMSSSETHTGKLNGNFGAFNYSGDTSAWTNIKFAFASGNIESGSFKLLGSK